MNAYIHGKSIRLDPSMSIGKGGEADIFNIGGGLVLKLFKEPSHPDYTGSPDEQKGAIERLAVHQEKLRQFPNGLPSNVIGPIDLAMASQHGPICGYTMRFLAGMEPLLRYSEKKFRQPLSNDVTRHLFIPLHSTLGTIHKANIVVGDFHDLNIMVPSTHDQVFIIDTDSFQFGKYLCKTFTERFVDPLLCNPHGSSPQLIRPHTQQSDWYSYAVMLMQCLLFVSPYGGIYRPKDKSKEVLHGARPLHRITVFHPEVRYPKPAIPYSLLSDDLLQEFHQIFEKDKRSAFPEKLIEGIRWTTCSNCSTSHARATCPQCKFAAPAAVKSTTTVRGNVTARTVEKLGRNERFIFVTSQGDSNSANPLRGELRYVTYDSSGTRTVSRENKLMFQISKDINPQQTVRVRASDTLYNDGDTLIIVPGQLGTRNRQTESIDMAEGVPCFDANDSHYYWASNGQLFRDDRLGPYYIGDVLRNQTRFWVGPSFGFGFYRAGGLHVAFVFDAKTKGINDSVKLPRIHGQLIDATCVFTDTMAWTFTKSRSGGKTLNQCVLVHRNGSILATAEAEDADSTHWLGTIRGKAPMGSMLFCPTDDGIVRVDYSAKDSTIASVKVFTDTEPFVDSDTRLLVIKQGLMAVTPQEIINIQMK